MSLRAHFFALLLWAVAGTSLAAAVVYQDVQPIIQARCAGPCHNDDGAAFFFPLTSFDAIKGSEALLVQMIESDRMPQGEAPGFKSSPDGQYLLKWLKTGADLHPDADDQCPDVPPPTPHILMKSPRELVYADVKPIIDRHCVGCHNPGGAMSRKPFTTLEGVRRHVDDAWEMLDKGIMPQGDPTFRFSPDGRALLGWLRYGVDVGGARSGEAPLDDGTRPDDD